MAKGKNNSLPANDYIEQLQWRSRHNRRFWPVQYEPKWKYKIVYHNRFSTPADKITSVGTAIAFMIAIVLSLSSKMLTTGEKVFFGAVFVLILGIIFFAVRDIPRDKDDIEDLDK